MDRENKPGLALLTALHEAKRACSFKAALKNRQPVRDLLRRNLRVGVFLINKGYTPGFRRLPNFRFNFHGAKADQDGEFRRRKSFDAIGKGQAQNTSI